MNLISIRPTTGNEVVGEDRVVSLLKSLLTIGKFLPRGFILAGPRGLGKTSVAYLLARSLMCVGGEPLGCGKCPSCQLIDKQGIEHSPDFLETVAASKPTAQDALNLMEFMTQPPNIGGRRIAVIDMAHHLSKEAWDILLKPLEEGNTNSIFIFVTTEESEIPYTVQSRSMSLTFLPATEDTLTGFLASFSSRNGIEYELPAIRDIARHSKGIIRSAVGWLGMAASLGKVTRDNVNRVLDNPFDSVCLSVLLALAFGDQKAATKTIDEAGGMASPVRVIEKLFSIYARSPWSEAGSELSRIAVALPNIREASGIFIKWLGASHLPADALPLFIHELMGIAKISRPTAHKAEAAKPLPKNVASTKAILQGEVI